MQKDKEKERLTEIRNFIVKHCKIIFPIIVIAVVAVTVSFALKANREKNMDEGRIHSESETASQGSSSQVSPAQQSAGPATAEPEQQDRPLEENTDDEVFALIVSYYNAMASGDSDVLTAAFDSLSTEELLRYVETANYIEGYAGLNIFTKNGLTDDTLVSCIYYKVCFVNHPEEFPGYRLLYLGRNEEGKLYIKNETNYTEEEAEYIKTVIEQEDVVEFKNRVNAEYSQMMHEHPELSDYLDELEKQINKTIGEALEALGVGQPDEGEEEPVDTPPTEPPVETGPQYAVATTTVNVRNSDSEIADRLGKVAGGTRVQVQEVRLNGWTKIVFEGKDGYIKSEYLSMEENSDTLEVIGTVTATTGINVRAAASQSSERLGLLASGESLELYAIEDGWCMVNYNGRVAYVKEEYVTH